MGGHYKKVPGCQSARVPKCQGATVPQCQGAKVPRCKRPSVASAFRRKLYGPSAKVPGCQRCQGFTRSTCYVPRATASRFQFPLSSQADSYVPGYWLLVMATRDYSV